MNAPRIKILRYQCKHDEASKAELPATCFLPYSLTVYLVSC
jgi:hypothetical protein